MLAAGNDGDARFEPLREVDNFGPGTGVPASDLKRITAESNVNYFDGHRSSKANRGIKCDAKQLKVLQQNNNYMEIDWFSQSINLNNI